MHINSEEEHDMMKEYIRNSGNHIHYSSMIDLFDVRKETLLVNLSIKTCHLYPIYGVFLEAYMAATICKQCFKVCNALSLICL